MSLACPNFRRSPDTAMIRISGDGSEYYQEVTMTKCQNKEFLTVKMLLDDSSCPFSEKALRFHIWKCETNGLAPAIFRIGKKILIKREEWIKWIESHAQHGK